MIRKKLERKDLLDLEFNKKIIINNNCESICKILNSYTYRDKSDNIRTVNKKCAVDEEGYFYILEDLDLHETSVYQEVEGLSYLEISNYINIFKEFNFKYLYATITLTDGSETYLVVPNEGNKLKGFQDVYMRDTFKGAITKIELINSNHDLIERIINTALDSSIKKLLNSI